MVVDLVFYSVFYWTGTFPVWECRKAQTGFSFALPLLPLPNLRIPGANGVKKPCINLINQGPQVLQGSLKICKRTTGTRDLSKFQKKLVPLVPNFQGANGAGRAGPYNLFYMISKFGILLDYACRTWFICLIGVGNNIGIGEMFMITCRGCDNLMWERRWCKPFFFLTDPHNLILQFT